MPERNEADLEGTEPNGSGVRSGVRATTLYRFFDANDALLYVGVTSVGPSRWIDHEANRAWWDQVARSTAEHFERRADALIAERDAIRAEQPRYNVVHATPRTPKRALIYRPHGTGSIIEEPSRKGWAAITPAPERRWFRFPTQAQAEAFLTAYVAAKDPAVRAALRKALG